MKGNTFTIGRGETEADYAENEVGISRLHAEIYKAVEGYGVKDLGSKNGTFLNEDPLVPYQYYPIKEGDTIRIVRTEFRIIV
jgi:pSer/pThr/pTyr-binding forkhead associated (FHA) protein